MSSSIFKPVPVTAAPALPAKLTMRAPQVSLFPIRSPVGIAKIREPSLYRPWQATYFSRGSYNEHFTASNSVAKLRSLRIIAFSFDLSVMLKILSSGKRGTRLREINYKPAVKF
jgi:hypothetical protein